MQTHVDNSFGNSLAFTMNNTYGELCFDTPYCSAEKHCSRAVPLIALVTAGTHVLLEACRMSPSIRRVINVSTDEVYGETSLGAAEGAFVASTDLAVVAAGALARMSLECSWLVCLAAGLKETATLEPTNPYSAAKAGAEMMAKAYLTSYRLPVLTTRGNNVSRELHDSMHMHILKQTVTNFAV